jgi:hypothetical protein
MAKSIPWLMVAGLALSLGVSSLEALGRRPDDEADGFPDYNRLEMHPKQPVTPETQEKASVPAVPSPPVNIPVSAAPEEMAPQPPPKAVPLPANFSEPPLPPDITETLVPSATAQASAPPAEPKPPNP